jgi:hypothetical protein
MDPTKYTADIQEALNTCKRAQDVTHDLLVHIINLSLIIATNGRISVKTLLAQSQNKPTEAKIEPSQVPVVDQHPLDENPFDRKFKEMLEETPMSAEAKVESPQEPVVDQHTITDHQLDRKIEERFEETLMSPKTKIEPSPASVIDPHDAPLIMDIFASQIIPMLDHHTPNETPAAPFQGTAIDAYTATVTDDLFANKLMTMLEQPMTSETHL